MKRITAIIAVLLLALSSVAFAENGLLVPIPFEEERVSPLSTPSIAEAPVFTQNCVIHVKVITTQYDGSMVEAVISPVVSYTAEGHTVRYYTHWVCNCTTPAHIDYLPANDPLFSDSFSTHNYVNCVSLGMTGATSHSYRWNCTYENYPYADLQAQETRRN